MPEPVDIFGHLKAANGCVIAETACGHDGDLEKLTQLIDSVAESGTKLIKFQLFYLEERALESEEEWHIFGRLLLQDEQWEKAVGYARSRQLGVITDVYGERSLMLAKRLGVDGFKVHSEDLLNSYFIARVAEEGQLLLISVGGAHRKELSTLLSFLQKKDLLNQVVLMAGVQTFPTPLESHSLEEISDLIRRYSHYGVKVGISDHVAGDLEEAHIFPLMALARGACVIEKHVTIDRADEWTDFQSALDKVEFKRFVQSVQKLSPLLDPVGPMNEDEKKYRQMFKKSPSFIADLPKGHVLKDTDIEFVKDTQRAIPISSLSLEGKALSQDVKKGELCKISRFENSVGGIIVARCTSDRLPNKALRKIQGRETVALVIDRIKRCKALDCLILATSTDPSDDPLVEIAEKEGVYLFRGSLDDVASRFYKAAEHYGLSHFARITGDALLCDEVMLDKAVESHLESGCDVTFMRNMPFGTHKEVVSVDAVRTVMEKAVTPSNTEYLEYYLENDRYFSVNYVESDYRFDERLRLTLDHEEDLRFMEAIFKHFNDTNPQFSLEDLVAWLGDNPDVVEINAHLRQKFYSNELNVEMNI